MPRRMTDILGNPRFPEDARLRLEPLARSNEVASGLAARVHDPAWMLNRQWQFGEFAAQDAGSPVIAKLDGHSTVISAWRPSPRGDELEADPTWVPYTPTSGPLDRIIESEEVKAPDELTRVEGGAYFARLLHEAGLSGRLPEVLTLYRFDPMPTGPASVVTMLAATVPDAARLAGDLSGGELLVNGLSEVGARWLTWWRGIAPDAGPDTYDPHRFEHRADFSYGDNVFHAEDYLGDGLDWFTVDHDATATPATSGPVLTFEREVIPSTVRFGGIPADRFWEMEDAQIDLGANELATLDTGRLLLIAFANVYGNDWFLFPLEVPAGSFTELGAITVTDSFGDQHHIERVGSQNVGWNMFTVTGTDHGLLVMPSERGVVGGQLETVALARDELANLAWAIEKTFTNARGERIDRAQKWRPPEGPPPSELGSYAVQTIVPDYWLPLVPHAINQGDIRFVLVPLHQPQVESKPHGQLLHFDDWIHEEEVDRDGALVTRRSVLARWFDGSWHSWVRREKNPSSGESSSGLEFDIVRPSEAWP
jgi:hypothetical protein